MCENNSPCRRLSIPDATRKHESASLVLSDAPSHNQLAFNARYLMVRLLNFVTLSGLLTIAAYSLTFGRMPCCTSHLQRIYDFFLFGMHSSTKNDLLRVRLINVWSIILVPGLTRQPEYLCAVVSKHGRIVFCVQCLI